MPYTRKEAFFPLEWVWNEKYWPPVSRIDNVCGDRYIICSCPPLSESAEETSETRQTEQNYWFCSPLLT